jgi:transcriptional antiterminator RfaH
VLYTRSRQEKALARHLATHRVPFYLPLVKRTHLQRGRKTSALHPLFGGYMFLYGDPHERVIALQSNRISQVLDVEDEEELRADLRQIRRLIAADAPLTVEQRLTAGQKVRIKGGSLAGVEGKVISRRGSERLLIAVNYLNQGVSIQIDDFLVEPI